MFRKGLILLIFVIAGILNCWQHSVFAQLDNTIKAISNEKSSIACEFASDSLVEYVLKNYKDTDIIVISKKILNQSIIDKNFYLAGKAIELYSVYYQQNANFNEALKYMFQALNWYETFDNSRGQCIAYRRIAYLYNCLDIPEKGLYYSKLALTHAQNLKDSIILAKAYINIGYSYYFSGICDTATTYYNAALQIFERHNNIVGIADVYNRFGVLYAQCSNRDYNIAINFYQKSLKIRKELRLIKESMIVTNNIGLIYMQLQKFNEAQDFFNEALEMAIKLNEKEYMKRCYYNLAKIYENKGDYKKAYQYLTNQRYLDEMVYNESIARKSLDLHQNYDNLKKQAEIDKLNNEKLLYEKEKRISNLQKLAFAFAFLLLLVLSIIIFMSYRTKLRLNNILIEQTEELKRKNHEIKTQYDYLEAYSIEISQQKEEILAQSEEIEVHRHDVEQKSQHITNSIRYARRIQEAILPTESQIYQMFEKSFIIFLPKDIVSGDFIWFTRYQNQVIFSVADCTGHGVPGAFMSLLAYNLLNQAVQVLHLTKPSDILNYLNEQLNILLHKKEEKLSIKDGIDLLVFNYDEQTLSLQYAGALNSFYCLSNGYITNYKSDIHHLGDLFDSDFTGFHNFELQLKRKDKLYIFTDGLVDQLGGDNNRKFLPKTLRDLLLSIHELPMNEQRNAIINAHIDWKCKNDQTDDILMLGIEVI